MDPIKLGLAAAGGLFYAVLGYLYKRTSDTGCRILPFIMGFAFVTALFMVAASLFTDTHWSDARLWYLGVAAGFDFVLVVYLLMSANKMGPASIVWTLTNLALLVPIAVFALAYDEPLYSTDTITIAIFCLMVFSFTRGVNRAGEVKPAHMLLFALVVSGLYLSNGAFMVLSKLKESFFGQGNSAAFGAIAFITATIASGLLHAATAVDKQLKRSEWEMSAKAGVVNSLGFLCFVASMGLPAIVAFPVNQGISLLGGAAFTAVLFKERINREKLVGFALGFALLLASVFREQLSKLIS